MPDPYLNTGVMDQRNAITRALMNVASPPPRSVPPMMPQSTPTMGLPRMPPPGAPPMGAPTPQGLPQTMPLTPGIPPMMRPGMTPGMPGGGIPPGGSAGPMPLNPNPMQRPGGI